MRAGRVVDGVPNAIARGFNVLKTDHAPSSCRKIAPAQNVTGNMGESTRGSRIERLSDCGGKLFGIEGFGKKEHSVIDAVAGMERIGQVTRNKHYLRLRADLTEPIGKITAAHVGH